MNLFRDIKQKREQEIPTTRRRQRQTRRAEARQQALERNRAFERTIIPQLTIFQYDSAVQRVLRRYNRVVCHGKGRVSRGNRSDIHWERMGSDTVRKADEVWTLCTLRAVDGESTDPRDETDDTSDAPRWNPVVVVGIDVKARTFIVNNVVIPLDKKRLIHQLERLAARQHTQHPFIIWVDSLGLEIIGGLIIVTLAFEVFNAVVVIEDIPAARAVIVAGGLFTLGLLLDISVFVGGIVGGAGIGGAIGAMVSTDNISIGIGAVIGGLLVALSFFADITLDESKGPNPPIILRKEEWLYPVLYGTDLSNGALVPFNIALGVIKGIAVIYLILIKLLPVIAAIVIILILRGFLKWLP